MTELRIIPYPSGSGAFLDRPRRVGIRKGGSDLEITSGISKVTLSPRAFWIPLLRSPFWEMANLDRTEDGAELKWAEDTFGIFLQAAVPSLRYSRGRSSPERGFRSLKKPVAVALQI